MKIAIVGCAHGEIEEIITAIQQFETQRKGKIDLLICCGDFQAIRNENDLCNMAAPQKYRRLNTFYKYYSGELTAPFPIICIGGNHEASNYLLELYHGGWLAPNIYYLGTTGSIKFGGVRISGLSGIFKYHDFNKGQHETLPMDNNAVYSAYHIRRYNVWKLSQLHSNSIDIMLSHEWPTVIWKYGNYQNLVKYKKHFCEDIVKQQLGNPALNHLLFQLQPKQWFSGHLHVKFSATVNHKDTANVTRFLALDKFDKARHRTFVQMLDFATPSSVTPYTFEYDPAWLAIIKSTNKFMSTNLVPHPLPTKENTANERWDYRPTEQEIDDIVKLFNGDLTIPNNFEKTVQTPSNPHDPKLKYKGKSPHYVENPQTTWLMNKLGIKDKLSEKHKLIQQMKDKTDQSATPYGLLTKKSNENDDEIFNWIDTRNERTKEIEDPNEIEIDLELEHPAQKANAQKRNREIQDPNEIDLELDLEPPAKKVKP
eukprot:150402_1